MEAERTERLYSRLSSHYDLLFHDVFQPGRRKALEALELQSHERVLEVGVGTGLVLPLYPRSVEVIGIDLSEGMLEEARNRIVHLGLRGASVLRMDAAELEFEDATFDAILAPYVISVVSNPGKVVAEMARVCRPGGRIVIVNHFLSRNPLKGLLERLLTPLSVHVGFRLDTPLSVVLEEPRLRLEMKSRVNILGNWTLLRLRKAGPTDRSDRPADLEAPTSGYLRARPSSAGARHR
jgi:phosphatidylethanolamine/phosphatidyl-N-methylethanolamine N-methyltransferase